MSTPERRAAQRIAKQLPLTLSDDAAPFLTHTKNLSTSGAYCTVRRFIAPMTKLQVQMEISGHAKPTVVRCEGVVVRVEPPRKLARRTTYNVAIFFSNLTDRDRATLARFVDAHVRAASQRR